MSQPRFPNAEAFVRPYNGVTDQAAPIARCLILSQPPSQPEPLRYGRTVMNSEAGDGGAPAKETTANPPTPAPPPPPPEPPAAAQVVVNGTRTEREIQLEADLEAERNSRKKVECDNAQLQDELHRLATPAVPPAKDRPSCRRGPLGVRAND